MNTYINKSECLCVGIRIVTNKTWLSNREFQTKCTYIKVV